MHVNAVLRKVTVSLTHLRRSSEPHEPAGSASNHANSSATTHQEPGYYVCGLEL